MYLGNLAEPMLLRECGKRLGMTMSDEITVPYQHKDLALASSLDGRGRERPDQSRPDRKIFLPQAARLRLPARSASLNPLTSIPSGGRWHRGPLQPGAAHVLPGLCAIVTLYQSIHLYIYVYRPDPWCRCRSATRWWRRRQRAGLLPALLAGDADCVQLCGSVAAHDRH